MPKEKVKARLSNVLILLAAFLVVPVVVLLLVLYNEISLKNAHEAANAHLIDGPPTKPEPPPRPSLGPKDDFYRYIKAGAEPKEEKESAKLHLALQDFVMKDDVLTHSKPRIWREPFFSLKIFSWEGYQSIQWSEKTDWCIRLRMFPGKQDTFASRLSELSRVEGSESIGLAEITNPLEMTPEKVLSFVDRTSTKELLIPVTTYWAGKSDKDISVRRWTLSPESGICNRATDFNALITRFKAALPF